MSNPKKQDAGASEGARATEDAPASLATAGGADGHLNARYRSSWNSSGARIWRALPGSIALPPPR
jgi:hypothetical protein